MRNAHRSLTVLTAFVCTAVVLHACRGKSSSSTDTAASTAAAPERIRGTVQSLEAQVLTVATTAGPVAAATMAPATLAPKAAVMRHRSPG